MVDELFVSVEITVELVLVNVPAEVIRRLVASTGGAESARRGNTGGAEDGGGAATFTVVEPVAFKPLRLVG